MKTKKMVLIFAITLLFTPGVQADSMRCGTHVIEDADLHKALTIKEVIKKCGQPSSRKGNKLYYKKKGKELHFDTNERLMSIHDIKDD
jgi:hypothetical protein